MKIFDLTDSYIKNILEKNDLEEYKKSFPEFFEHYYSVWAKEENFKVTLDKKEVKRNKKIVLDLLPVIEKKLKKLGIIVPKDHKILIFVGQKNSNGHSFKFKDEYITWLALESYNTKLDVEVFATHEIVHSLFYENHKNENIDDFWQEDKVSSRLINEGMATYISKRAFNLRGKDALWASYLSEKEKSKWYSECEKEKENIKKIISENYDKKIKAETEIYDMFNASDPNDIYKFRSGYYLGLKVIEKLLELEKMKDSELIKMSVENIENKVMEICGK
jgi:uncharacterized protein YjaZ